MYRLYSQVEDLVVVEEQLEVDVRSIETCPYSAATLADILSKIQHAVDDLSLRQYSNLHLWVQRLDEEVILSDISYCCIHCEFGLFKSGRKESRSTFASWNKSLD